MRNKLLFTLTVLAFIGSLTGCTSDHLNAPCPNFGAACAKTPVNSWDYNQ